VAFVTGAGSGIGRAIAERFASEGARVVVNDIDVERAQATVRALAGDGHRALAGDVSDAPSVSRMFAAVAADPGRLDVLVNNAGVSRTEGDGYAQHAAGEPQITSMSDAAWNRMLAIHCGGAFLCSREALRLMLPARSGSLINISSIAGLAGMGTVHYATAKAGLLGFTRALARDLGRRGIRVNAICPGVIDTPMTRDVDQRLLDGLVAATPLGRRGEPGDIAAAALYLASDDGRFVTGQWLSPNGGVFIG